MPAPTKDPNDIKAEANEFFKNGSYREALRLYDVCLSIPDINDNLKFTVLNNKTQCLLNLDCNDSALLTSLEALRISPNDPKALFRSCQAYERLGRLSDALQNVRKLLYLDPNNTAAQSLARKIESNVSSRVAEAESLSGRICKMFDVIMDSNSDVEKLEKAICNLSALIKDNPSVAGTSIWKHPDFSTLYSLCKQGDSKLSTACHRLFAQIITNNVEWGLAVLNKLTPQYFVSGIYSRDNATSLEMCRFLNAILECLTQLKAYHQAKEAANSCTDKEVMKVAPTAYPRYKLDPLVEKPIEEILKNLFRCVNSYRISGPTRDYILEMLVRLVPSERGIGWSQKALKLEGIYDCLLEVAGTCGLTSITNWRSRRSRMANEQQQRANQSKELVDRNLPDGIRLATTQETRMIIACLMAYLWDDLVSDKQRDSFTTNCSEFILDLFADEYLETKVEAASIIGTLFLGPYEVGSSVLSRQGILEGLLLLTQCPNMLYQTIALDTIVLATHKKEQCMNIVSKAVPILQSLYKSENDGTRIRALVALCKLGAAGGSDASIQSLSDGSNLCLMNACKRLLLGVEQLEPGIDQVSANKKESAEITPEGEILIEENEDEETNSNDPDKIRKHLHKLNLKQQNIPGLPQDPESARWALEGLAYLTLNGEIKQEIVGDSQLVSALFNLAKHGQKDSALALASVLAHLTNSWDRRQIEPEMIELAKFAKQHIPEEHPMDSMQYITKRRQTLMAAGLPSVLYELTIRTATDVVGSQKGLSELISRIYLSCSEAIDNRGLLAQAGAGKALLKLALSSNTDTGKILASQALARLAITADPRATFPGQRSMEIVRPLLQLLSIDCSGLQNFESLLALTNVASLSPAHRHRIMAERGIPLIDHYLFEDHEMLRRAATECVANLAQSPAFVVSCGGRLPMDEQDLGAKLPRLATSTNRVKLLVCYCTEFEDLLLVRAASGALATMSHDPGIIEKITETSSWFETLQTLAGHSSYAIQHRATHILRNFVIYGEKSLSEYICKSNMLEVLMSLSQLPDHDSNNLPAEDLALNPGLPKTQIEKLAQNDRAATKSCAKEALLRLQEYGLVKKIPDCG